MWSKFKRFWLEEEVPRWIGLSLVAAYLSGLGALAYVAHRQEQEITRRTALAHGDHAMELLSKKLALVEPADTATWQRALREFSLRLHCDHLRVINDQGLVTASLRSDEIGKPSPFDPASVGATHGQPATDAVGMAVPAKLWESAGASYRRLYRYPIPMLAQGERLVLDAMVRWDWGAHSEKSHAWMAVVVLAGLGVLWIVYHLMRRHFRGLSRIADNLVTHAECLEAELASLRVADSLGTVACTWNKLIDLMESFRTEARRSTAATELRQVLERSGGGELADAIDAMPDGLFVVAEEELVVHCNAAATRLMGWKTGEMNRPRLGELPCGATGQAIRKVVEKVRGRSGTYESVSEVVECEGSSYRVRVVPQRQQQRHGACVVVISDVSQQVRADRAREEFVSQVTHELRTPLTNIRAYSETLSSGMFEDPKIISECYNVIQKETRRLSRLIEDILSASQMELGHIQIVEDEVDVRALIREAVRDLRATADEKNIDVQAILPAKVDPIQADRDKLAVVLNNLIGNALKYTPAGGEVRVGCQTTDDDLLITVKDTGIGIAKEEQDQIFEKFQRSKDPAVQQETGTGIGLTTARELTRRHGGDIELMSEKGKGSTFVVKLPRKKSVRTAEVKKVEA